MADATFDLLNATGKVTYGLYATEDPPVTVYAGGGLLLADSDAHRASGGVVPVESPPGKYGVTNPGGLPAPGKYYLTLRLRLGSTPSITDPPLTDAIVMVLGPPPPPPPSPGPPPVAVAWGQPAAVTDLRVAAGADVVLAFAPLAGIDPAVLGDGTALSFAARSPLTGAVAVSAAGVVTNGGTGAFSVTLPAASTAALTPGLGYPYDVWRTDSGHKTQLARGRLLALPRQVP